MGRIETSCEDVVVMRAEEAGYITSMNAIEKSSHTYWHSLGWQQPLASRKVSYISGVGNMRSHKRLHYIRNLSNARYP